MAEPTTEDLIKEHLTTLPKPVKDAINSFDWARDVFQVGRKYNLHVDDIGELQTEVMLVVLGLTSPREFEDEVHARIESDSEKASAMCEEINIKVFMRIRDFMKNYYAEEEKKGKEIVPSERNVLRNAGIKLGDEPEEIHPEEGEEEFINLAPATDAPAPMAVPIKKIAPIPTPVIPDIKSKLENSAVFKSPSSNYLDPYREPVE
jgi:nucleotide-binding universal stress UspA family protein